MNGLIITLLLKVLLYFDFIFINIVFDKITFYNILKVIINYI